MECSLVPVDLSVELGKNGLYDCSSRSIEVTMTLRLVGFPVYTLSDTFRRKVVTKFSINKFRVYYRYTIP